MPFTAGDQTPCGFGVAQIASHIDNACVPTKASPQVCEEFNKILGGSVLVRVMRKVVVNC